MGLQWGALRIFRSAEHYEYYLALKQVGESSLGRCGSSVQGQCLTPAHTFFAGILIDGLEWGKSDLDGNGLSISPELGLYRQQQVAQASESQRTQDPMYIRSARARHFDQHSVTFTACGRNIAKS